MVEPWLTLFLIAVGAWLGALVVGNIAVRALSRSLGREASWPALHKLFAIIDLFGTWCGVLAGVGLWMGRVGYGLPWASAVGIVALMVTAGLYDRAVLLPSLDAAFKRLKAGEEWARDWQFLSRMAAWGRWGTVALGLAALWFGYVA